jgi:type III secretory pathway lipoprotein EscJ
MMISPYYRVVLCGCKNHLKLPSFGHQKTNEVIKILVWHTFHVQKDARASLGYVRLFYHINLVIPDRQRFEGVGVFRGLMVFQQFPEVNKS